MTLEELTQRIKEEILSDVFHGNLPIDVKSFAELHDYVDANCYGGLCEDRVFDALVEQFGGRDDHDAIPEGMVGLINSAQNAVGDWIVRGGAVIATVAAQRIQKNLVASGLRDTCWEWARRYRDAGRDYRQTIARLHDESNALKDKLSLLADDYR